MTTLLHIKASPRDDGSHSEKAANHFIATLRDRSPELAVTGIDIWDTDLPNFDGALLAAKYARLAGQPFTDEEARAWSRIEAMVHTLDAADIVLISTPMWNLSIPYRLKHYIDLVAQPGLSFSFSPETGYTPLLRPRPVVAILASAGDFSAGLSWGRPDLATPYLREALKFIGLVDAEIVPVGPTAGKTECVLAAAARAARALDDLSARFTGEGA
jgi:FMN-dependent NADH-azoreductase